jgi:RNA polymerase sigma-70 factor (ECF subfamily)
MPTSTHDVTAWLTAWRSGDLAKRHMRRERALAQRGQTLETKALVNEAYLRLVDASRVRWENRAHFLAVAATLMRRILVDAARTRRCAKRGGEQRPIELEEAAVMATPRGRDLVELDDALSALAKMNARKAQVVELRFFGGLSVEESAHVLNVSAAVLRDWRLSKAWLLRELSGEADSAATERAEALPDLFDHGSVLDEGAMDVPGPLQDAEQADCIRRGGR